MDKKKNESERLESEASFLLEDHVLNEAKEWYQYALKEEWSYVVFVVRRCYILALIMEKITGKEMEQSSKAVFLTDASIFLHCEELAEAYRKKRRFPQILLCDDIMIHGRNVNHILEGIEARLCELLREYDAEEIRNSLVSAVQINVFTRTKDPLLLLGRYELNLHYFLKGDAAFIHQLSNGISMLILRSNISNASYIFSEHISESDFEKINLKALTKTRYQNLKQYVRIKYLGKNNTKRAVYTLRLVENKNLKSYRAVPFVFLPNLGTQETEQLLEMTIEKIEQDDYAKWLRELYQIGGRRTFNELMSLIYSYAILNAFNDEYHIKPDDDDFEYELTKLARNYNQKGFEQTRNMLSGILKGEFLKEKDLDDMFESCIHEEKYVVDLVSMDDMVLSDARKNEIRQKNEDYFYKQGSSEEMIAFELSKLPYFETWRRSERAARGCCFILHEISKGYKKTEMDYCIAYFLQMMDVGVLSLSSYAPNKMRVVGFAQFAKAGEQSLSIMPLRMYLYIPMLAKMQYECEQWRKDIFEEVEEYGRQPESGLTSETVLQLQDFLREINEKGQQPRDWIGNYFLNVQLDEPKEMTSMQRLVYYMNQQDQNVKQYSEYAQKKYYR